MFGQSSKPQEYESQIKDDVTVQKKLLTFSHA